MSIKNLFSGLKESLLGSGQSGVSLLSFRILYLCIFLPPVLYIFSIQGLESYLQKTWKQELRQSLIQDQQALLQGRTRLQEEIKGNIQKFRKNRQATRLGVEFQVLVRSAQGQMIYPVYEFQEGFSAPTLRQEDLLYSQLHSNLVALENQRILQQGLNLSLTVQIPRNTWLANLVLLFYIFVFTLLLYFSYQSRVKASERAARIQEQELQDTKKRLQEERQSLQKARQQQEEFQTQVEELQHRLQDADFRVRNTQEEALAELESLEEQLAKTNAERQDREQEVQDLAQRLEQLQTGTQARNKKQDKQKSIYSKRFQTLYKQLIFQERALEGFSQLPEDWKLKAEEIIHTLNADPSLVSVKRKVFSRSNVTAWETEFAHKGRIYWRKTFSGKIEILAVGSKNTQARDLKYLESLDF
ncbi:MAG: hypothetical protein ACQEQX_05665 [Thermodesulfobacteriota bacterium]